MQFTISMENNWTDCKEYRKNMLSTHLKLFAFFRAQINATSSFSKCGMLDITASLTQTFF